ncbi:MAG TPA: hypothetical protein VFH74_08930 [Gaiellales bacterium]|nr:hypothetical protein [Gaiellales bacterium]
MSRQTNVAGAAVLAGLIAGGTVYAAGHRVGDPALTASADARSTLIRIHPAVAHDTHLLRWHPARLPKHAHPRVIASGAAPVAPAVAAAAPVAVASAPVTHTSPAASGDDGQSEAGDD